MKTILVTGGAGFIGTNLVRLLLKEREHDQIVNLDALTYAGNLENLADLQDHPRHVFVRADIAERDQVEAVFQEHEIDWVMHLAAESHVDRSIMDPGIFIRTNVLGTQNLLDCSRAAEVERFLHVSTDEVYGSLGPEGLFREDTPLAPNSPYSASKAGSDLLVRAAFHTHGFPALISRCSNNYGPYQFPEKLIPLMIANALAGEPLPVYGDGRQIRDWIHVADHCEALLCVLLKGQLGEVYNIGGNCELPNIDVVQGILLHLDLGQDLIRYVKDRPGHDRRYAMDASKLETELGFAPRRTFSTGLPETIGWYQDHQPWVENIRSGSYQHYYKKWYGDRI